MKKVFVSGCYDMLHSGHVAFSGSFEAQIAMFPHMVLPEILKVLDTYKPDVLGWKVSGAGGGGYLILVSEQPIANSIQIRIRR